jgi:hypothetical protein
MPNEEDQFARRVLEPSEIIRSVKQRYRVCNYLFKTGACWILIGGFGTLLYARIHGQSDSLDASSVMTVFIIGAAFYTAGLAMTLAIYRCPVCDKYLSRFRPDKLRCPGCNAKVK